MTMCFTDEPTLSSTHQQDGSCQTPLAALLPRFFQAPRTYRYVFYRIRKSPHSAFNSYARVFFSLVLCCAAAEHLHFRSLSATTVVTFRGRSVSQKAYCYQPEITCKKRVSHVAAVLLHAHISWNRIKLISMCLSAFQTNLNAWSVFECPRSSAKDVTGPEYRQSADCPWSQRGAGSPVAQAATAGKNQFLLCV